MFGRTRRAVPPETRSDDFGYDRDVALVARADTISVNRNRALNYRIGVGLQGYSGTAVGYDRGDPANSLTTVLVGTPSPTLALATIGRIADATAMAPPAEITDIVMSDPALDPYQALLWNRISR